MDNERQRMLDEGPRIAPEPPMADAAPAEAAPAKQPLLVRTPRPKTPSTLRIGRPSYFRALPIAIFAVIALSRVAAGSGGDGRIVFAVLPLAVLLVFFFARRARR